MELIRDATNPCPLLSLDAVLMQDIQQYHNPNPNFKITPGQTENSGNTEG